LSDRLTTPELDIIFQVFQNEESNRGPGDAEWYALLDRLSLMADHAEADGR
jgi:hypothetical protein